MASRSDRTRELAWPFVLLTLAFLGTVGDGPLVGRASAEDFSPRLKEMVGVPEDANRPEIEAAFAEDMKTYAVAIPAEDQNYRTVLKFSVSKIAEMNGVIAALKEEVHLLKKQLHAIPAEHENRMAAIRAAAENAQMELARQREQAVQERVQLEADRAKLQHELNACRKQMAAMAATAEKQADEIAQLKTALVGQRAEPKPAAKQEAAERVWADASGQHRVEAVLVKLEDGKVFLRRRDGRVVILPLDKLSREDQEHVRGLGNNP